MATTQTVMERRLRAAGLGSRAPTTLESVERRRLQLWILTAIVIVTAGLASVIGTSRPDPDRFWWAQADLMRFALLALAIAFCVYAIEKELHLRRLTRELVEERSVSDALQLRIQQLTALMDTSRAVNSVLELDEVLHIILSSALDLLDGAEGSVMLVTDGGWLKAVCSVGNERARGARVKVGEGIAGRVAATGEPLLLTGSVDPEHFPGHASRERPVDSAMSVPLRNRGELLGVLNCTADAARAFTEVDLNAFTVFAEQAASAIANARLYEAQREHVKTLLKIDEMKTEFVAGVSHDLRTPLTSITGSAAVAMRDDLPADARRELLESVRRQAGRLEEMVQQLLEAATHQHTDAATGPIDLAERLQLVAAGYRARGTPVEANICGPAWVQSNSAIDRALTNLIDNAVRHGAPPVEVSLETHEDGVVCSVSDAGPGVPIDLRARVFERFFRADPSRHIGGLGLGLAITRSIVEAHGGSIWIEEPTGGGACVRFSLPSAAEPLAG